MTTQIASYQWNDSTVARFEVEPPPGFRPAGVEEIADRVREAAARLWRWRRWNWAR
jgi:hypothetical protein